MTRPRIHDDELHAQFVTFSCYRRRRSLDHPRGTAHRQQPFWQPKYYPFNLYSEKKALEKLDYMHKNPVTARLVGRACDRRWSSARYHEQDKSVGVPLGWVF